MFLWYHHSWMALPLNRVMHDGFQRTTSCNCLRLPQAPPSTGLPNSIELPKPCIRPRDTLEIHWLLETLLFNGLPIPKPDPLDLWYPLDSVKLWANTGCKQKPAESCHQAIQHRCLFPWCYPRPSTSWTSILLEKRFLCFSVWGNFQDPQKQIHSILYE